MIKFGLTDSLVIPLALPGALLCLGSAAIIHIYAPELAAGTAKAIDAWLPSPMGSLPNNGAALAALVAGVALVVYLLSVFLGVILAIVAGYVEILTLDHIQQKRSTKDYWETWYRYIEHLEDQSTENVYLSGLADLFLFQFRCAVALSLLAALAGVLAHLSNWPKSLTLSLACTLLTALLLFGSSYRYHNQLAYLRSRRFSDPPSALDDGNRILQNMILRWCERKALEPLRLALAIPPLENSKANLAAAVVQLDALLNDGRAVLFGREREALKDLKQLIETKAAAAP